jgi:excisionase family DNA binding protein
MNLAPPQVSLTTQWLTPAKVAWLMDVGESTVAEWYQSGELEHFKHGRKVRIPQEGLLKFIYGRLRRSRSGTEPAQELSQEQLDVLWRRIERLILATIEAQICKIKFANLQHGRKEMAA